MVAIGEKLNAGRGGNWWADAVKRCTDILVCGKLPGPPGQFQLTVSRIVIR